MGSFLYIIAASILVVITNGHRVKWELPLDKAKVNYHHQRICIIVKGQERCVNKDQEPGDASEVAKLFKVVQEMEAHVAEEDPDEPQSELKTLQGAFEDPELETRELKRQVSLSEEKLREIFYDDD